MSAPLEELRQLATRLAHEDYRGPEPSSVGTGRRILELLDEHALEVEP